MLVCLYMRICLRMFIVFCGLAYVVQQMLKTPILYHQEGRIKACNKYNNNNKNNTKTNTFTATTVTSPTPTTTTTTTTTNTGIAVTTTTTTSATTTTTTITPNEKYINMRISIAFVFLSVCFMIVAYFKINKQHVFCGLAYVVQQMLKTPILYHQEGRIKACNKYNNNNKNNTKTNTFTATTVTSPTPTTTTTTTTTNTGIAVTTTTTTSATTTTTTITPNEKYINMRISIAFVFLSVCFMVGGTDVVSQYGCCLMIARKYDVMWFFFFFHLSPFFAINFALIHIPHIYKQWQ
uniref:Uncharacterized protein n=1 Tax=Glossina palpalis gambiensis TaxID=67801 RepID=A0A1B0AM11_9MUSC